jgi:drug/metabolite transporter (DMT)-like permease
MGMSATDTAGDSSLLGDLLALAGGGLAAAYLTIGREVRQRAGIGPYGAAICGACALWLLAAGGLKGVPLVPPSAAAWGVLLAMALGPQLLGHVGFNYAVRYVPAAVVGAVVLLEPVGATVLATFILDEWPSATEVAGAVGIVLGVGIATRAP